MSANQRLIEFINEVTVTDLLLRTKIGKSSLYKIKHSGGANVSTLQEIFESYPNLSPDWIFKGIGKMWTKENSGQVNEEKAEYKTNTQNPKPQNTEGVTEMEVLKKQVELLAVELKRLEIRHEMLEKEVKKKK